MIDGKRVLAIVPARGGSKGLPLKNIWPFLGKPLIAHVGEVIKSVPYIDRCVVSTDHEEIAEVAEKSGIAAPFRRPPDLSGDIVGDADVLRHALLEMERMDSCIYDIVVMLQPTSPLRTSGHVTATIEKLHNSVHDAIWTLSETDSKVHPYKQLLIVDEKINYYDDKGKKIIARQQLDPLYHRNGAAYAIDRKCLIDGSDIMGKSCGGLVIDEYLVSIDTEIDIDWAEFLVKKSKPL